MRIAATSRAIRSEPPAVAGGPLPPAAPYLRGPPATAGGSDRYSVQTVLVFGLLFYLKDVALGEEVGTHVFVENGVDAAEVFERHHGVLNLLVAVVGEDAAELFVLRHL